MQDSSEIPADEIPAETPAETQAESPADAPGEPAVESPVEPDPASGKGSGKGSGKASGKERSGPVVQPPPPERLEGAIEAVLLVAGDVVRFGRLRDLLGLQSVLPLKEAVASIQSRWAEAGLAMELEEVAGGVRVVTRPEYAEYVGRLLRRPTSDKLSRTQLETLCIVAYKQPVGRAEVERIRGVQAGEPLRALLERRLLKVVGRSEQPGRPLLYGTTQQFLTAFGLKDVKDLPSAKELQRL